MGAPLLNIIPPFSQKQIDQQGNEGGIGGILTVFGHQQEQQHHDQILGIQTGRKQMLQKGTDALAVRELGGMLRRLLESLLRAVRRRRIRKGLLLIAPIGRWSVAVIQGSPPPENGRRGGEISPFTVLSCRRLQTGRRPAGPFWRHAWPFPASAAFPC